MEDNPYSAMIRLFREDALGRVPAFYRLGTVVTASPLKIAVAGTVQTGRDVLINPLIETFVPGERLLLVPIEDEQRYIVVCKVVSP